MSMSSDPEINYIYIKNWRNRKLINNSILDIERFTYEEQNHALYNFYQAIDERDFSSYRYNNIKGGIRFKKKKNPTIVLI